MSGQWVAVDPAGGSGLLALRSGAVLVDHDVDLEELCVRVAAAGRRSLTIFLCAQRGAA
ncbi:MAG: hypothetical protein RMK29_14160 [Myxococcales bacterium]|nr:hypothetical protein [Myxococcota bacterium]MDW8282855.1 hypothetical protein [Myxococcales bacterium]